MSFSKQNNFDQNDPLVALIRSFLESEGQPTTKADAAKESGTDLESKEIAQEKTTAEYKKNAMNKDELGGLVDPIAVNPEVTQLQPNQTQDAFGALPNPQL